MTNRGPEVTANDGGDTEVGLHPGGTGVSPVSLLPGGAGVSPANWNVTETRGGSNRLTRRMLWGTRYTDELVWIEVNGDPSIGDDSNPDNEAAGEASESPADMRYYAHQDRNWNVTALSEYDPAGTNNGRIVERYEYTPYGSFRVLTGDTGSGATAGRQLVSTVGSPFAHQGLPFDHDKGSYQNRWREYYPNCHRYGRPDPVFETRRPSIDVAMPHQIKPESASRFVPYRSNTLKWVDPQGLIAQCYLIDIQLIFQVLGGQYAPSCPWLPPLTCCTDTTPAPII